MALQRRILFANKSTNTDLLSEAVNLERAPMFSIHVSFSGTVAGTLKIQGSNLLDANDRPSSWADIDGLSKAISSAGDVLWNVDNAQYSQMRLVFIKGLISTGTVSAVWNSNGPS